METEAPPSSVHANNDNGKRATLDDDDDDRFSALPDDVLLLILERVDLLTAVRAGAAARRWRHLPRLLIDLDIDVATLLPHRHRYFSVGHVMAAYADATAWFLPPPPHHRNITSLRLSFYLAEGPHLRAIGDAVAAAKADRVQLDIRTTYVGLTSPSITIPDDIHEHVGCSHLLASFVAACPAAFARLTSLALHDLSFPSGSNELSGLLNACHRLELLSLSHCTPSLLEIDAPSSGLLSLELHCCSVHSVELSRVPKLERLLCDAATSIGTIRFGSVPRLRAVDISAMHLHRYIENPALLSPALSGLRDVRLCNFVALDMHWILHLLQAAPLLNNLSIQMLPCWFSNGGLYKSGKEEKMPNVKHHNLTSLEIKANRISKDANVKHYIGLIRECAACLKRIRLLEQCDTLYLNCSQVQQS
ncbi:uncharacterized protein [Lolium perenne]|uniref:uncharacterized protein n=1 Tax=Lolium perenne TaxID=4522 RepID=UPI0021F66CD1|nr:uncharacterized protein LOC127340244 [Lolium perenne]